MPLRINDEAPNFTAETTEGSPLAGEQQSKKETAG